MTILTPGRPFRSREPRLTVENDLPPGRHRFQLTVIDDDDLESQPAELVVVVLDRRTTPQPSPPIVRDPRLDPRLDPRIVTPVRPAPSPPTPIGPFVRPVRPIR